MTEKHENLAAALAAFQLTLPKIGKGNTAQVKSDKGNYSYKYADLSDVSAAVLPALAAHGLSFSSKPTLTDDGRFVLAYRLRHESGDDDAGTYPLPTQGTPQAIGSAISYARRYVLSAISGVAPDEDDDGQAASTQHDYASHRRPAPRREQPQEETSGAPATQAGAGDPDQARGALRHACEQNGWDLDVVAERFSIEHQDMSLRNCTDALVIAKFRSGLFKLPQATLQPAAAAVVNGAAQ